jgi:cobalt-zinc-cadmium efflux system membrane fusion protein
MAGRVVERKVDVGTAVGSQGDPSDLYTVTDLSTVWVDLPVTPSDLGKLKEGGKVGLTSSGAEDKRAEARIIFVSPILNQETRAARVIASLDNRDLSWRPGTFVTAEIEIARDKADVIVPRNALQTIGGERVVFVRTPKGFQRRDVNTGRADDDAFEITSGLSVGEEIAVKNTFLLKAELGRSEAKHDD